MQALTSAVFAIAGLVGLTLFLAQQFRLAALVPVIASWGWRACAENLRADHRGGSRISAYQIMAIVSVLYLTIFLLLVPSSSGTAPDLSAAFPRIFSGAIMFPLQVFWVVLFLYYGRSRVTASTLSFRVVADRV